MQYLVILSSSVAAVTPPNHRHLHRHHNIKPPLSKLSPSTPPSTPSSSPISTAHSRSPLLSTLRYDTASGHKPHLNYYADLASKLAHDGRFDDFALIAESVIGSGVNSSQFVGALSVELVAEGISEGIQEGRIWEIVEVLRKLEKLGIRALKLVDGFAMELLGNECRRMLNGGLVEEVVELMEILAGCQFSIKELVEPSHIIKSCVNRRNPNLAIRYVCILPHAHKLLCNIINEFGKKRDMVSALTAFEASKQKLSWTNMYAYRTIIDVCGLCGDYMKSRYIYEELLSQKVTPNIYIINSLMNVNSHDLSYTLHVYKNMQNLGVTADTASYNILLKACCLAKRVDLAQDIYKDVKHLESAGELKLDVFTYSTIIKVFADAKLWQMALKIKEDMLSAGVTLNTVTWSSLISSCANAGLIEPAIQLFEEMILAGCEPNSQCCNILLHACVEARQYDRAFRLFQLWKGGEKYDDSTDKVIGAEHKYKPNCGSNLHHLSFVKRFPFTPTTATYNILMKACGTDYIRAKCLMDEMKAVGLSPNHISWSILIDMCGRSGNVDNAIQILKTMRLGGVDPDVVAYTTAIKVCVESKKLKLAFSLFSEMKRCQLQPNLVTYNTLLRARSKYGSLHEVQQCLAIYQDMRRAGYNPNDYYLQELIEEWCEGVIQNNNQNHGQYSSSNRTDLSRPQSLLLEKVAAHLQKNIAESLAIDLQGLTKVESRIVVLAVLQMIKENYALGHLVRDDILIILEASKVDADPIKQGSGVKTAIVKLLRDELGLQVILAGPRIALDPLESDQKLEALLGRELPTELEFSTRRPAALERLKITRKSLQHWLQRRVVGTNGRW